MATTKSNTVKKQDNMEQETATASASATAQETASATAPALDMTFTRLEGGGKNWRRFTPEKKVTGDIFLHKDLVADDVQSIRVTVTVG